MISIRFKNLVLSLKINCWTSRKLVWFEMYYFNFASLFSPQYEIKVEDNGSSSTTHDENVIIYCLPTFRPLLGSSWRLKLRENVLSNFLKLTWVHNFFASDLSLKNTQKGENMGIDLVVIIIIPRLLPPDLIYYYNHPILKIFVLKISLTIPFKF